MTVCSEKVAFVYNSLDQQSWFFVKENLNDIFENFKKSVSQIFGPVVKANTEKLSSLYTYV